MRHIKEVKDKQQSANKGSVLYYSNLNRRAHFDFCFSKWIIFFCLHELEDLFFTTGLEKDSEEQSFISLSSRFPIALPKFITRFWFGTGLLSALGRRSQITCNTAGSIFVHTSAADMETQWDGSKVSALNENERVPSEMYRERVCFCAVRQRRLQSVSTKSRKSFFWRRWAELQYTPMYLYCRLMDNSINHQWITCGILNILPFFNMFYIILW